ncbi:GGDEF domain-containing protein [Neiella sp. HB171785]|uniref:diguanylate cyclase n=1 Tax=Neiella litorisoli TaxID=2771431 RepID=A0A8J6QLY9_9GAMM|nr:GGDEF domain-containing protein [Neiella litorisoli]MBD1390792.1 GGDEF domain-containing protein [Neiella litorisoli]
MTRYKTTINDSRSRWIETIPSGHAGARVSMLMHLVALVTVVAFAILHMFWGHSLIATALSLMAIMLAGTVIMGRVAPDMQIHLVLDALFILSALPISLWALTQPDMYAAHLIPALLFAAFFVLPIKVSSVLLAIYTCAAIYLCWQQYGPAQGFRIAFGLSCCYGFTFGLALMMLRQQQQLTRLAFIDPLTGAYNRNALFDELERAVDTAKRHQTAASLVMLDVDHFKPINDEHGHAVGDEVLVWLAEQLITHSRKNDRLFRLGGDEFLLLLPDLNDEEANQVIELIKSRFDLGTIPHQVSVTMSAGLAQYVAGDSVDDWLEHADQALYQAKSAGRDCCRCWQPSGSAA